MIDKYSQKFDACPCQNVLKCLNIVWLDTSRPTENGWHFADGNFKCIVMDENLPLLSKCKISDSIALILFHTKVCRFSVMRHPVTKWISWYPRDTQESLSSGLVMGRVYRPLTNSCFQDRTSVPLYFVISLINEIVFNHILAYKLKLDRLHMDRFLYFYIIIWGQFTGQNCSLKPLSFKLYIWRQISPLDPLA